MRHFWSFVFAYKKEFLVFAFFLVSLGVLNSLQPFFYREFIRALPTGIWQDVIYIFALYAFVRFGNLIADLLTYFVGDMVLIPAARDARLAVFKKVQELDLAYHLNKNSGSLISAFKRGDLAFFNLFHKFNIIARIFINLVIILVSFSFFGWLIVSVTLASMVLNAVLIYFLLKHNIKTRNLFNREEDKISGIIVDNLINYETVKLFAQENYEYKRLKQAFKPWFKSLWRYANSFRLIDISLGVVGNTLLLAITYLGINQVFDKKMTDADFIMILGFISAFYWKFFDLIYNLRELVKSYSDIQKYFSLLEEPILITDPARPVKNVSVKGEIVFDDVHFIYRETQKNALQGLNLHIRQGQSVALVGRSGAGKTTVVKLLLRFFDIQKGKITIDGIDIRRFRKSDLRALFGIVPQEPVLFNNSLGFNIAYGRPDASEKEIIAAAKMAHAWEFIKTLPKGLDTLVGERGVKLSGGQRQRIAIARVILKNPKIIIFDEATSSLDSESEALIQEAFWQMARKKTTIVIAHRLSTIVAADKIVVIDEGKVLESGSHNQLIHKDGLYKNLWQKQTGLID